MQGINETHVPVDDACNIGTELGHVHGTDALIHMRRVRPGLSKRAMASRVSTVSRWFAKNPQDGICIARQGMPNGDGEHDWQLSAVSAACLEGPS